MNTVVFYDTKNYEQAIFEKELFDDFSLVFKDYPLNDSVDLTFQEENAQIISVFPSSRLDVEVLRKFKNLKLLITRSVGFSHIDIDYCSKNGIVVANAPSYGDYTVAEFSFALLLNLVRRICFGQAELKIGEMYPETFGMELYGKTIGIVGTGAIGSKSVKIAKGFSMNVICYDICHNLEIEEKYQVKYTTLDTLCKLSDIIMLHAPLNTHSYHMLDREKLSLLKESAVIINTARGELIDTEALYDALIENKIKGAALDVLEFEDTLSNKRPGENLDLRNLRTSLINSKLMQLSNVIATPHMAYDTNEAIHRILNKTLETIREFNENNVIKYRVN